MFSMIFLDPHNLDIARESPFITLIIIAVICMLVYRHAYKKGTEKADSQCHSDGYKEGIKCVEDEIKELSKLPDEEIIERVKKFGTK